MREKQLSTSSCNVMANNQLSKSPASITALVIAHNEEKMIANCIETLAWCQEIIVLDNDSSDSTPQLAEELGARVIHFHSKDFSALRQEILKYVKTEWVFYVDCDERVTPELAKEILVQTETNSADAYTLLRQNYFYGQVFNFTGTQRDFVTRVFKTKNLKGWKGEIHESPVFQGNQLLLRAPLWHFTHRTTQEGLLKSAAWTQKEAQLLFKANVAPVGVKTILRKGVMEVLRKIIKDKGYKDGMAGWVEALIQGINRMLVYIQVWELQQQPSISKKYQQLEQEVASLWRNTKV